MNNHDLDSQESNNGMAAIVRDVQQTKTKFKLHKWAGADVYAHSQSNHDLANYSKIKSDVGT